MIVTACFRLVLSLEIQQQQEQEERVPDGHGRSFGSLPWQKGCLIVMVDPDLGHGKKTLGLYVFQSLKQET